MDPHCCGGALQWRIVCVVCDGACYGVVRESDAKCPAPSQPPDASRNCVGHTKTISGCEGHEPKEGSKIGQLWNEQ